jgi:DNA-binding response OmpR family regulator
MSTSTIRVLHIEDDRIQHGLIALHLLAMKEYQFETHTVVSEDEAIETWRRASFDLVLLDYQLSQGNGLSCLVRLRKLDSIVPIITLSATATSEIAAELIEAGADDYLAKQGLSAEILGQSVRNALTRARAFRTRFSTLSRERAMAAH